MKNLLISVSICLAASVPLLADAAAGKAVYEKSCKRCHGADGTPVAAIAKMLKVEMRHLGSAEVQAKTDAVLKKETVEGVGKMKPVTITDAEAVSVVAYIRTLKK